MNSIKLLAAIAALGLVATPAMSQSTNTMSNSMGSMSSGSMGKGSMGKGSMGKGSMDKGMMDKGMMHKDMSSKSHMMPMNHAGMSKKTIAMCHKMSHARMMKSHQCRGLMKHGKMMKHAM
jgi:hypothetical protein